MSRALTLQCDTVDLVCLRHYGRTGGVTEQVLDVNPGLAANGPVLPEGVSINLPDPPERPNQQPTINLWD